MNVVEMVERCRRFQVGLEARLPPECLMQESIPEDSSPPLPPDDHCRADARFGPGPDDTLIERLLLR